MNNLKLSVLHIIAAVIWAIMAIISIAHENIMSAILALASSAIASCIVMVHYRRQQREGGQKSRVLIIVDMQNDFVSGALGTREAQNIVQAVKEKICEYKSRGDRVIFTRDTHHADYLMTSEGKHLPVEHCVEGTSGWNIVDGLDVSDSKVINKGTFGYLDWEDEIDNGAEIEIVGLCTDICVVSNAIILKAMFPEATIKVDSAACAGVNPETHEAALTTMKMCQIEVV